MTSTHAYGEEWYWDKRYEQESGLFDWYQKYQSLYPILHLYIPRIPHRPVLVVGCGNSAFSEGMVDDGYEDVVSIDISSVVIETMKKRHLNRPQLKYIKMDVRDMSAFQTGSFDAVIDKGTLDSLLCGHNSRENAVKMLKEVERVLEANGVYILITYGAPTYRLHLLRDSFSWSIKLHVIAVGNHFSWMAIQKAADGSSCSNIVNNLVTHSSPHAEKSLLEGTGEHQTRDLTSPVPLDDDGRTILEKNPDVHYIYVCIKDDFQRADLKK